MAGLIRFTALNPYWNIPPDLVPTRVAKHVLKEGTGFLRRDRLQLLSDWSDGAHRLDPAKVDWRKVAAGRQLLRVRQLPGPGNMLGSMKFMMPNDLDIYLHDTPDKSSFAQADRRLSSGCVRVEDAARLARWLFKGKPPVPSGAAEQRVDLPEPVPVYITYLTALPTGKGRIAFQQDVYGRDAALLARLESEPRSSSPRRRG
jgi:murein L,D-transpeptidase YcbB/YkuD